MFRALSRKLVIFNFRGRIHSVSRMLYRILDIRSGVECIFGNRFTRPRLKYADNSTLFVFYNHKYYAVRLELSKHGSCARPRHSSKKFKPKLMNNQWLIIEQIGEDVVLKKCSQEAEGTIVVPENVTRIEKYAFCLCEKVTSVFLPKLIPGICAGSFMGSSLKTLVVNGVEFEQSELQGDEYSSYYNERHRDICKKYFPKNGEVNSNIDTAFCDIYNNFLSFKEHIVSILRNEVYRIKAENAFFYLEGFLYEHFAELSEENKELALCFLEHSSKCYMAEAAYAHNILEGNIKLESEEHGMNIAMRRLASAVYNQSSLLKLRNIACLADLLLNHMPELSQRERKIKAAQVMFKCEYCARGEVAVTSMSSLTLPLTGFGLNQYNGKTSVQDMCKEVGVDVKDIVGDVNEDLEASGWFKLHDRMQDIADDICKSLVNEEDLQMTPFIETLIEYFVSIESRENQL